MKTPLFLVFLGLLTPVRALLPVPGAWESFTTQANANAWTAYAFYYDDRPEVLEWVPEFFFPGWSDTDDSFIGYTLSYESVYLFADSTVATGAFVGDYAGADVEWLTMDVSFSDPSQIDYFDVSILSDGDGVQRYYYSDAFSVEGYEALVWNRDVDGDGYRDPLAVSFKEDTWYWWDSSVAPSGAWLPVTLSESVLSNITEIGITFFHVDGEGTSGFLLPEQTTPVDVRIDNVSLSHPLLAPELAVAAGPGGATFSFQPLPAHRYDLQQFNVATQEWDAVSGKTGILGPDPFSWTPTAAGTKLLRCVAERHYTEVVTSSGS